MGLPPPLNGRQTELVEWLAQQRDRQDAVGTLPTRVRSFLKGVQSLDTLRAKELLQTILSAAHVYRDGRIELEGSEGSNRARAGSLVITPVITRFFVDPLVGLCPLSFIRGVAVR